MHQSTKITYRELLIGIVIHEFIFHENTRFAFDEFVEKIIELRGDIPENTPWYSIVDFSESGFPPLKDAIQRSKDMNQAMPTSSIQRTAIIHESGTLFKIAQSLIHGLTGDIRFFEPVEREVALLWLQR